MKNNKSSRELLFERMAKINPDFKFNEDVIEGVSDKYLKQKYNIPDEFDDFEKIFGASKRNQSGNVIYQKGSWQIIKNPFSLAGLGNSVRGVITEDGDLYIESHSEVIHNDILKILADKGILSAVPTKNWTKKLPQETKFLTVQRYKNSKYIAIGESNRLLYDELDYNKRKQYYSDFLNKAKSKMPNIDFMNRLVGTKKVQRVPNKIGANLMNESFL